MAYRLGSGSSLGSTSDTFCSHTSSRPSLSVSCTSVLNTVAPHDRQSNDDRPSSFTLRASELAPAGNSKFALSKVGLSQSGPAAPVNGPCSSEYPAMGVPLTVTFSEKLACPSPTMGVRRAFGLVSEA